jgi:uncharacterized protein
MKKTILTIAFVALAQMGFAQEDAAFKSDVIKVIEKSGSGNILSSYKDQILQTIPSDKHAAFTVEFETLMSKINEGTAKIFMEEYTKEDIKAMLAFYESPVGIKMKEKSGIIMTKSQETMMELQGEIQALVMKYMQ